MSGGRRKDMVRKRRTREHVLADLSVNHVERQALLCGYAVECIRHDYGIDLELLTFDRNGEVEPGAILLQLKATDRRLGHTKIPMAIDRRDLVLWLAQPLPVILIVYSAPADVAYWCYVQDYFARRTDFNLFEAGKQVTVHLSAANRLDMRAIRRFARFRDRVLAKLGGIFHEE